MSPKRRARDEPLPPIGGGNGNGNGEPPPEPEPPVISSLGAASGTPGAALEILGTSFTTTRIGRKVEIRLQLQEAPTVTAAATSWGATRIVVTVPSLAALGSGGPATVVVRTGAGTSNAASFTVLEPSPPAIIAAAPAQALPGDELRVTGHGFGLAAFGGAALLVSTPDGSAQTAATIRSWRVDEIRAALPSPGQVGGAGAKLVCVRTLWGTSDPRPLAIGEEPTLSPLPVAMLPVRLETRYADGGAVLRIRIFPDDCAVDSHEPPLTPDERELALAYRAAPADERPGRWRDLVARYGPGRAAWLAQAPLGGADDPGTRTSAWTRAPRTRVLPSRWFAFGYKGDQRVFVAWGKEVPDELAVGPDPTASTSAAAAVPVDEGIRWLVDFDAAVEKGMALRVDLPPEARGRLDRLVVIGVKAAPTGGVAPRLAELLGAHRYTRGLGFLEEGTPTNNTRAAPAGDAAAAARPVPPGPPVFTPEDGSNRSVTARAFGLDESALAGLPRASAGADVNAGRQAMSVALWPVTLGYFLQQLLAPAVSPATIEAVRAHFLGWVRGNGPLPVVQVGTQPYGVVVATPLDLWQPRDEDVPPGLVDVVRRARRIWRDSLGEVPRIGRPGVADESENLLATLALQPTSISYRGRSVLGRDYVSAAWRFLRQQLPDTWWQTEAGQARRLLDTLGLNADPRLEGATFASGYFTLPSPPVARDPADPGAPLAANYLAWLGAAGHPGYRSIRDETFPQLAQLPPPRPLLYLLVRHSLLREYLAAARGLAPALPVDGREQELVGVDEVDDDLAAPRPPTPWDELAYAAKGRWLDEHDLPRLQELRGALQTLSALPVRTLERLLAETLDVCSHRLDAWATSVAQRRLDAVRSEQRLGVHLAGWGAVLGLEPDPAPRKSRGFVHAPSLAHATAAAILASGYLSHAVEQGRHPLAIDLSSERVRLTLRLLDGVRQGTSLGALLGYRFERGLHERGLDRYVDDFRRFAPLRAADGSDPLAARSVVDALELQRRWVAAGRSSDAAGWPAVTAADRGGVDAALATVDDAVDAVADALLAEGVFQIARGNPVRVAGALDAAAGKGPPPAELEVVQTPRGGTGVTHRLLTLVPDGVAAADGWERGQAPAAAREAAEPRLDALAARLLPSPSRVVCGIEYVDAAGGVVASRTLHLDEVRPRLCALDVVNASEAHEEPQRTELEQRLVYHAEGTAPPGTPDFTTVRLTEAAAGARRDDVGLLELLEVGRAAREALLGSRAVTAADLSAPESPPPAMIAVGELESRAQVALAALRGAESGLTAALIGAADALREALLAAAGLGVVGAVPGSARGDLDADRAGLQSQAEPVLAELRRRRAAAVALPAAGADPAGRSDRAVAVLAAVFGPAFRVLPLLSLPSSSDPLRLDVSFAGSAALTAGEPLAPAVWLQRAARVRDGARRLADAAAYADALSGGDVFGLTVAQLPARPGDRWIGLPFPSRQPLPAGRLSFVAALPFGAPAAGQSVCGLFVDEWTETVPAAETTTGLAFHFDRPNAAAPQAIVLAVPPRREDWTLRSLEATVLQTLELAQSRMVDLDALRDAGHYLPAIHLAANLRGATIATDLKAGSGWGIS